MKKDGFTLAEVLITLTIIGVIATMTLPALLTNTQEQQAKTALKKSISTLTDIAQMNQAIDGYDYAGLVTGWGNTDPETKTLYAMIANRGSVDFQKSTQTFDPKKPVTSKLALGENNTINSVMYLRDGSSLLFSTDASQVTKDNGALLNDGLPNGFNIIVDTNGDKGPNIISNCQGDATGAETLDSDVRYDSSSGLKDDGTNVSTKVGDACITKSKRVIKDQFIVRLRGGHAVPYGDAAQWAYEN